MASPPFFQSRASAACAARQRLAGMTAAPYASLTRQRSASKSAVPRVGYRGALQRLALCARLCGRRRPSQRPFDAGDAPGAQKHCPSRQTPRFPQSAHGSVLVVLQRPQTPSLDSAGVQHAVSADAVSSAAWLSPLPCEPVRPSATAAMMRRPSAHGTRTHICGRGRSRGGRRADRALRFTRGASAVTVTFYKKQPSFFTLSLAPLSMI